LGQVQTLSYRTLGQGSSARGGVIITGGFRAAVPTLTAALLILLLAGLCPAAAEGGEERRPDPPRGPGDVPPVPERDASRRSGERLLYGIVLFFLSIPIISLEIYTIFDPREAYLLFRRGFKYQGDVELTDFYLLITRVGGAIGLILYSLLLIVSGYTMVLLLAFLAVGLMYLALVLNE